MSCFARVSGALTYLKKSDPIYRWRVESANCLHDFQKAGIDVDQLAADLQSHGAQSFDESWQNLLSAIESKGKALQTVS